MSWQDWSYTKRGAVIGLIISAVLVLISYNPLLGEGSFYLGMFWSGLLLKTTGLDYILMSIANPISDFLWGYLLMMLISSILLVLLCSLIGFIFDREESWIKKLIIIIVLLLIFTPLSINSQRIKDKDKEILSHYNGGWPPDYITADICDELSVFSTAQKPSCYADVYRSSNVNKALCDNLLYTDKIDCYYKLANQTGDYSHCNFLIDTSGGSASVSECYIFAAVNKKDAGICTIMKNNCKETCDFWFEQCVTKVNA